MFDRRVFGPIAAPAKADESFPLKPSSPYPASKASEDLIAQAAHTTFDQEIVIAKCSNNYGPRKHREKLIPILVHFALRDQPPPIYGLGKQVCDWIHVDHAARGLIKVFESGLSHSIYSLGANCKRTNIKIASTVLEHLDKPESLIEHFRDRPWRDLRHTNDTARAMATLGWQPLIPFQERFEKVVRELGAALGPN